MAQSLSRILLHLVFSTKNREKIIPEELMPKLHAYIAGICRKNGSDAYLAGGTENHVYIACTLPRTTTVSKLLEEIKKSSSFWIKKQEEKLNNFAWQSGYGAFFLGLSQLDSLLHYIENQKEHHRYKSFEEEYLEFLHKYQIEYDSRFLWD